MRKYASAVVVFLFVCVLLTCAQTETGQIFGVVTDSSGAVLPGVKVTITSPALLQPIIATTSGDGSYQFPGIPIGMYSVQFDVTGYRSVLRENIRIEIGFNAQVSAQLNLATVIQSVEVSSAAPVIDTQSTTQSAELDLSRLQELPSARSMWNMAELTPGVTGATKDVGGATNGPQASFVVRGDDSTQVRWFMDGIDLEPAQGPAFWVNTNIIKETQITTGGADPSQQASGMTVNMVSKTGSDRLHGTAYYVIEDEALEANNLNPALLAAVSLPSASAGPPLQRFGDWGGEVGGPIKHGKLWFWGSWGEQTITVGDDKTYKTSASCLPVAANPSGFSWGTQRSCTNSDPVYLKHLDYKLSWSPFHNNTFTFENGYSVKDQAHFMFSTTHPTVPTTVNLSSPYNSHSIGPRFWDSGWPPIWKFDDQDVINDRWVLDVSFGHFVKDNTMAAQSEAIANTAVQFDQGTGGFQASNPQFSQAYQPMSILKVTSSYFLPGKLGGDHTIKIGYDYARYENIESQEAGGSAEEIFKESSASTPPFTTPFAVNFYRSGLFQAYLYTQSFWLQDTYTHKRFTLNLGFRFDHQYDTESPESIPASPYEGQLDINGNPFNFLPAFKYAGHGGVVAWNNIAPRLGVNYNLLGNGKTVLKASFSRYFDLRFAGELSDAFDTITTATANQGATLEYVEFPWNGAQANGLPLMSGVNTTKILQFGNPYQPANPTNPVSVNSVDPNIKNPNTYEFVAGFSQELAPGFGLDINFVYRKYVDIIWHQLNGISSANYVANTFTPAAGSCPTTVAPTLPTQCPSVTYFNPNIPTPAAFTITNEPDFYRNYKGLEISMRKVMSHNWMLDGGITIQSSRQYWTKPDSYQDPTNVAQENGAQNTTTNARWLTRLGGQYRLPWHGIAVSANNDFRQGYCNNLTESVNTRTNSAGTIAVYLAPPCTLRFKNLWDMDIRVDKTFSIHDRWQIEPAFDLYNAFNNNTILAQNVIENGSTANRISTVLGPRVARFGVLVKF